MPLQVGRAHQRALSTVPQATEVGHASQWQSLPHDVLDLHKQKQEGVDQVVKARREVEVHERVGQYVDDWVQRDAHVAREGYD